MPIFNAKGDIFEVGFKERFDLIVVFWHVGLNFLRFYWDNFRSGHSSLAAIDDPFSDLGEKFTEYASGGKYIVFVSEVKNNGMSDSDLSKAFKRVFEHGIKLGLKTVITNGVSNIDHSTNSAANALSNRNRVVFIRSLLSPYETNFKKIMLINLNDSFINPN